MIVRAVPVTAGLVTGGALPAGRSLLGWSPAGRSPQRRTRQGRTRQGRTLLAPGRSLLGPLPPGRSLLGPLPLGPLPLGPSPLRPDWGETVRGRYSYVAQALDGGTNPRVVTSASLERLRAQLEEPVAASDPAQPNVARIYDYLLGRYFL